MRDDSAPVVEIRSKKGEELTEQMEHLESRKYKQIITTRVQTRKQALQGSVEREKEVGEEEEIYS